MVGGGGERLAQFMGGKGEFRRGGPIIEYLKCCGISLFMQKIKTISHKLCLHSKCVYGTQQLTKSLENPMSFLIRVSFLIRASARQYTHTSTYNHL